MIGIDLAAADEKKKAEKLGTDLIGITQMSRFEGATKPMDACYIFPDAKSIFVLTFRIPLGALRIIEKGTLFSKYPSMGYAVLNQVYSPMALWNFTRYQKDHGYETVLMLNANGGEAIYTATGMFRKGWSGPRERIIPILMCSFIFAWPHIWQAWANLVMAKSS